jgi:hypothetical protein
VSGSADQLANRLVSGGRAITRANRVGVEQACLAGKEVLTAAGMAAGLPSPGGVIRGVGVRGSKWRVRYDVKGYENPVGIIRMYGAVHLVNNDTSAHEIAPRRKKALAFPDGGVRGGPVHHPGTRGKKFFEKAEPVIVRQSERIITQTVRGHLARVFSGS